MIALLCSVQAEAELLLSKLQISGTAMAGSKSIIHGMLAGQQVLLCAGGMGKVNAAHASTVMITEFGPEALIVFGIGGAYPSSGAQIRDVVLAREEIAGDEGVLTKDGFRDTEYIGIPLIRTASSVLYTTFPAAPLLERSLRALRSSSTRDRANVHVGPFVTLSTCTGTSTRALELEGRYHGLCENMEGAAAAQVAALHEVPWIEVRGISNIVEDRDLTKWDIAGASLTAQKAVLTILESWSR